MTRHACPDCRCAEPVPQPATSSTWARRAALTAAADAIAAAKAGRGERHPEAARRTGGGTDGR